MQTRHNEHSAAGFTLIEMMITVSIAAILLAVSVPTFRTFTYSQRVKTSSFDMYSTLMFARSEAIKRRADVTVTAVSSDWNNGWTVSVGATTLRSQDPPRGISVTSGVTVLTYRLDGRLTAGDASLLLSADSSSVADAAGRRCIQVDTTGLPRTVKLASGVTTCT